MKKTAKGVRMNYALGNMCVMCVYIRMSVCYVRVSVRGVYARVCVYIRNTHTYYRTMYIYYPS